MFAVVVVLGVVDDDVLLGGYELGSAFSMSSYFYNQTPITKYLFSIYKLTCDNFAIAKFPRYGDT